MKKHEYPVVINYEILFIFIVNTNTMYIYKCFGNTILNVGVQYTKLEIPTL